MPHLRLDPDAVTALLDSMESSDHCMIAYQARILEVREQIAQLADGGPLVVRREADDARWRIDVDRYRLEIDHLRAIVSRVVEIPREPEAVTDDERGETYLRGWQDARALVDKALLPEDSVIHKPSVVDEEIHNGDEGRGE